MDKLLILNVITIIALSCANCKGTLPIQLFKVFNRIQNCDVQIVYGDLESANIQPFPNLLVLTSLIFASNFPRKRNWWDPEDWNRFAIDISRTRVPPCQLAILFSSKFLKYESKREFQKWTRFGTDRHFRFGKSGEHFENWSTSIKNTYVILVTDYEKKELAKVFLGNYFVVGFIENAGIVFNHGIDNLFEFCVLRSGEPTKMTSFNCETNIKSNFLEQFNKLQTKLQNWELSTFDNTDINLPKEGGIVELIRVPEFINPFDRSDINSSIHQHVAQSIFRKSNSTLSYCRHDYLGALTYSGQIKLGNIEGRACFYIVPFQREVWYGILSCGVIVYIGIVLIARFIIKVPEEFPVWLELLAGIFENGGAIPGKLEQRNYSRCLLGGWGLACVVLANSYNGLIVTELNAPMVRNIPKTFSDLVCSLENAQLFRSEGFKNPDERVSQKMKEALSHLEKFRMKLLYNLKASVPLELSDIRFLEDDSCFRLLSPVSHGRLEGSLVYDFEYYLYTWYAKFREMEILSALRISTVRLLLDLFHPRHARRPRLAGKPGLRDAQHATEKEIAACTKAVFIADPSLIDAEIEYLRKRYFWIDFHKGRDVLGGRIIGWMIGKEDRLQSVSRSYWAMLESGIYKRLLVEITARKIIKEKRFTGKFTVKEKLEPVGINGGILTLFILILCLNLGAFVVFLFEFHTLVWQKVVIMALEFARTVDKLSRFCWLYLNTIMRSFQLHTQIVLIQVMRRIKIRIPLKFG
ncbi:hypothetical protein Fcan01_20775 [Folsomia candida]|uniref:Uncharacterized protein n=1 Tax=Folsomia candida TaxID=158441 RepID=A0A226DGL5_FOLCA|nr:hypothetical protein Fcan01_20775 [Folsomia candida]